MEYSGSKRWGWDGWSNALIMSATDIVVKMQFKISSVSSLTADRTMVEMARIELASMKPTT